MNRPPSPNRTILEAVAARIQPLLEDVVFVGGQVVELMLTDPAATRVRATIDVDVVVTMDIAPGIRHSRSSRVRVRASGRPAGCGENAEVP